MDKQLNENLMLESKLDAITEIAKSSVKNYSNEFYKVHTKNEAHLLQLSTRSSNFERAIL